MKEFTDPLIGDPKIRRRKRDDSWLFSLMLACLILAGVVHVLGFVAVKHAEGIARFFGIDLSDDSSNKVQEFRPLTTKILSQMEFEKIVVQSKKTRATQRQNNEMTRFSGEQTQRVEKETVNPNFGDVEGGPGKSDNPPLESQQQGEKARVKKVVDRFGMSESAKKYDFKITDTGTGRLNGSDDNGGGPRKGSRDRLPEDIAVGADTLLNTDEYVYASFFNRLKAEVGPRWEPMIQRVLDDSRKRLGDGDYITQTRFVCDRAGNIESVEILRRSGVALFDDAAEQALLQTRRVMNPPQAFLELDGRFRFKLGFEVTVRQGGVRMEYIPDPRFQ